MSDTVIYHVDANFLLNYLIPDNRDIHEAVRVKIKRDNWYNDVYRVSKYAMGEVLNRVLNFPYTNSITWDSVTIKMMDISGLITEKKIVVFGLDNAGNDWQTHFDNLMKIRDSFVQRSDRLILAFFCADQDARKFYTVDYHIITSKKITKYIENIGKRIIGI
jgi:hypothetical protein